VSASRALQLKLRGQFFCYVVASIAIRQIVGADMALWRRG